MENRFSYRFSWDLCLDFDFDFDLDLQPDFDLDLQLDFDPDPDPGIVQGSHYNCLSSASLGAHDSIILS
ncbi:hypothetical protein Hanom_Chr08g00708951 [Helianthus anomalus]